MRRFATAAGVALSLLVVTAAQAGTSLPSVFASQIRAIHAASHVPAILLPRSMPLNARHLYPTGGPAKNGYDLELGAAPHCNGANACFVADFTAHRGSTVFGTHVEVRGATAAGFVALSCGASCAPPQIIFVVHGIRYTIQAGLTTRTTRGDRTALINAAQAAISAGPR